MHHFRQIYCHLLIFTSALWASSLERLKCPTMDLPRHSMWHRVKPSRTTTHSNPSPKHGKAATPPSPIFPRTTTPPTLCHSESPNFKRNNALGFGRRGFKPFLPPFRFMIQVELLFRVQSQLQQFRHHFVRVSLRQSSGSGVPECLRVN